jgi:hypothetical protein
MGNRRPPEADTGLVHAAGQVYDRGHDSPRHRLGPFQGVLHRGRQRAVPVVFQNAPAAFDRVVLAVIRRIVCRFQRQLPPVRELDQALHEPRAGTGDFQAVVQVDQRPTHTAMRGLAIGPLQLQAIRHKVAGACPSADRSRDVPKTTFSGSPSTSRMPAGASTASGCTSWSAARADFRPRATPRRENSPIFTLALVSSEMRSVSGSYAARTWTCRRLSKIASVSGTFFGSSGSCVLFRSWRMTFTYCVSPMGPFCRARVEVQTPLVASVYAVKYASVG